MIDTHAHLDGEEFRDDLPDVIQRACEAGVEKIFVPAIDLKSSKAILELCRQYPDRLYPMVGLHPEEVRADWREQLAEINTLIHPSPITHHPSSPSAKSASISIGVASSSKSSWKPSRNKCAGRWRRACR